MVFVDLSGIAQKHAEFAERFEAFANTYLSSEAGRAQMAAYEQSRTQARAAFERLVARREAGADVTDDVLNQLLPYTDTPANREAGRWIAAAPVLSGDIKTRYEAAGWTDTEDWPKAATAVLEFVERCVTDPAALPDACAAFAALPYTKGFQSGMLSPILNALRPDDFIVINGKSQQVVNYFAGTSYRADLTDYPDLNATAFALIDAVSEAMHTLEVEDGRDVDLFDAFCTWLVTIEGYDFRAPLPENDLHGVEPFAEIFASREEAEWALDLMRETLARLGVTGPEDKRWAVTLTQRGRALRLNYGKWAILHFYGPCYRQFRVGLALMEEHLDVLGPYDMWRPFATDDGVHIRVYVFPMETARPLRGSLRRSYEQALDDIAKRFGQWRASNYRRFHRDDIATAIFDLAARDRLFQTSFCERVEPAVVAHESQSAYAPTPVRAPELPLSAVAESTGVAEATLAQWVAAIERKGQAILYGPPGTGKTYLAEMLARHLVGGSDGFWEVVQFHPAYAYEDFVQGLRPQSDPEGRLTYEMVPGRLLEFCAQARQREGRCVLIIDEINRADLARVFGEVMYLLEYRDREIPLAGGGTFNLPDNVRIIGTMNTADRSIALVDHALRRRFAFISIYPDYDILRHYHARHATGFPVAALIEVLARLNEQIGDPHYYVGITFFLDEALVDHIEGIWRMEIEPYLEELFFDQPDKVAQFRWARVAPELQP